MRRHPEGARSRDLILGVACSRASAVGLICLMTIPTGVHKDGEFAEFCGFSASRAIVLPN